MALENESEATLERLQCRLKQISLLLQVKEEHHDRFKALTAHHLRKNLSLPELKSLLDDTSRQSTIKSAVTFAAVTFLDTYGPALWPYNSKTRSHLLNAPLSCWGSKRGSYGPVYVKDAFMTFSARGAYRRKSNDVNPSEDEIKALSKMGKFMTEYFDALLHVIDDDGNEDKHDGQTLLSAIVSQSTSDMGDSPGGFSQDVERTAQPSNSRESSPDEPLMNVVRRKRNHRRGSNDSSWSVTAHVSFDHAATPTETVVDTPASGLPSRDSSPDAPIALQRLHSMFGLRDGSQINSSLATGRSTAEVATPQTEPIDETVSHEHESRESSPETPLVVERLHQLLATQFERPASKENTATSQTTNCVQESTSTPATASMPSNDQALTTTAVPSETQGLSSQPNIQADNGGVIGGVLTGTMTCEALDTAVANFGAYMQNTFRRNISGQPRTIAKDVQIPAPVKRRRKNPTGLASYQSTLGDAHPRPTADASSGTAVRRFIPGTNSTRGPAGNKWLIRGDDGQRVPKRRAVEMPPPPLPPFVSDATPPHLWEPITAESLRRPTPEEDGDWDGMVARLAQYRIATGGLGGLPRV